MASDEHDIAVVGMACRFPHAPNLNAFWQLSRDGNVAYEDISSQHWNHSSFYSPEIRASNRTYSTKAAFLTGIDEFAALHFGIPPRRLQVMDPQHRLAIELAREALQDAAYDVRPFDRANTGVFVGASVSEYKDILTSGLRAQSIADGTFGKPVPVSGIDAVKSAVSEVVPIRAFSLSGSLLNMIAASVSQTFDFGGPAFTLDAACSSALVAIHEAVLHLRSRECNVALAGGIYLNLTPDNLVGFSRVQAISLTGECRPFDAQADGFVMGEGAGIVVLKRLADASHDGDRVYAIIRGSGCSNDGRSDGPMTPRADGQLKAIERAYHDAENVPTSSIGYIEAHGTATTVGDAVELSALNTFFDRSRPTTSDEACCFIGSIKANIGHAMSAAGVAGFINSVLALQHAVIPPHASLTSPNPALKFDQSVFRLATTQQSWPDVGTSPRRAAVSSFGFGGTNAHMILEQGSDSAQSAVEREELFLVSAPTPELLSRHLADLADAIEDDSISPAVVAFTLAHRVIFECRMAFVASNSAAMLLQLRQASRAAAKEIENFAGLGNGKLADVGRSFIRDGKSNAMQLMQASDYRLGTLPPTPLERQRYWAIEPAERPYWGASGKSHGFQAEAAISSSPEAAQASLTISAAEIETHHQIEKYILTSVAGITAFPLQRLRLDQRLVGELGFDSLMLADLEEDIRKQWPRASKLPFEILPPETTIADVVRYVLQQLRSVASENDERETEGNSQTARARISALLSRSNDKYLNDHVISGHCVLPFAVAMNYLASAATQWMNTQASAGFVITGFHAVRPVIVYDTTQLEISSPVRAIDPANDKIEINLDQDGTTRYRAAFSVSRPAPKEIKPVRGDAPSLSLQDFYEHGTFHGPLLRGIFSINEVSDVGIGGKVFTSKPRDWIKHPTIQEWTIDPLAIDGGFRLPRTGSGSNMAFPQFQPISTNTFSSDHSQAAR